jgi:hypothetical protein
MTLSFLQHLLSLAALGFTSGLFLGMAIMRGEIGPRRRVARRAPVVTPLPEGPEAVEPVVLTAPRPRKPTPPLAVEIRARLEQIARFLGPAGLLVAGMLAVLIFGSLLINWLL